MASTYLTRNHTCSASTFTYSTWIKVCDLSTNYQYFFSYEASGGSNAYGLALDGATNTMYYYGSGANYTTQKVRDPSAWYHVVLKVTSGTGIIYINGEEAKTGISVPSFSSGESMNIGAYVYGSTVNYHFDGYMADIHFTDGTAYAASTFGETDTTGVWVPKIQPSVTYGTNGFFLKFANSGAMGTDSSGNSNTFSVSAGTLRQVPDTPSNVFATWNSLDHSGFTFSEGNLKAVTPTGAGCARSTIAISAGKWYWENLFVATSTGSDDAFVGVLSTDSRVDLYGSQQSEGYLYYAYNGKKYNGDSGASYGATWTTGDIIGVAFDADNGTLAFYKNGSSQGTAYTGLTSKTYAPVLSDGSSSTQITFVGNFGQDGTFAGNKTAQNNADGNGEGNFYYAPPSGFLALCTDNLSSELTIPVNKGADNFNPVLWSGDGSSTRSLTGVGFQPDFTWHKIRNSASSHMLYDSTRGVGKRLHSDQNVAEATETASGTITSFDSDGFSVDTGSSNNFYTNESGKTYVGWNWKAGGAAPSNTYVVKVVSDSGNKYRFDDYGTSAITLELQEGGTFTFDQSDNSNSGHPLRFSTTANGTHGGGTEYTTGVTTNGTPGQAGAYTRITVASGAPTLYYYCTQHSGMGGQANTGSLFGFTNVKGTLQGVVSPNTTAGFSIVTFTGNGASSQTIGHGLNQAPVLSIRKKLNTTGDWFVHTNVFDGGMDYLKLNTTDAKSSSSLANFTATTSGADETTDQFVAYFFHSVEGYSKIATYTGNGNADGTFVYTGFRPAWLMVKRSDSSNDWVIFDNKRTPSNVIRKYLYSNSTTQEDGASAGFSDMVDFVSNGFKLRNTFNNSNGSGISVIYMAFAENPFVTSTGKPVTAR